MRGTQLDRGGSGCGEDLPESRRIADPRTECPLLPKPDLSCHPTLTPSSICPSRRQCLALDLCLTINSLRPAPPHLAYQPRQWAVSVQERPRNASYGLTSGSAQGLRRVVSGVVRAAGRVPTTVSSMARLAARLPQKLEGEEDGRGDARRAKHCPFLPANRPAGAEDLAGRQRASATDSRFRPGVSS